MKRLAPLILLVSTALTASDQLPLRANGASPSIRAASDFPGTDVGQQINAAYAALPDRGGEISVTEGGSFATPIVFGVKDKPVLLIGVPGDVVELIYTGRGTAVTFDYGMGHRMGHGLRDLTVTGPGNSSETIGVLFGGVNGAEGITFRDFKVQGFGRNLQMGSHTWLAYFDHGMIRDGGINVLLPSGLSESGEQIVFSHITFADAPPPHRNSVWVQGAEVVFSDCSFDQAQLRIGNAQVVVHGCHFENPNYQWPGSVVYDYVTVDNHPGNLVRLTDSYFLQNAPTGGPSRFIMLYGGKLFICGVGMYTPAGSPLQHFATLANGAAAEAYGFSDLSGNITGAQLGY